MPHIFVNISDAKVSTDAGAVLATYSLGSCIGVALHDPLAQVAGMLHYQLPTSSLDVDRAKHNPLMFADTGMKHLLGEMEAQGAHKSRLRVALAGAAQILDDAGLFDIGRRNHAAIREILAQHGLPIAAEDCGGTEPRNLYLNVADGAVTVKIGLTKKTL
jgi:chemotaxis protein CheD